jgi:hypothetical protein
MHIVCQPPWHNKRRVEGVWQKQVALQAMPQSARTIQQPQEQQEQQEQQASKQTRTRGTDRHLHTRYYASHTYNNIVVLIAKLRELCLCTLFDKRANEFFLAKR